MENRSVFRSIYQFEKTYFPEAVKKREEFIENDPSKIGSHWAQTTIDEMKKPLIDALNKI